MKKVLFVTYDFPYPTNSGGKNRAYHMLKHSKGFKKYLFSFVRSDFRQEYKKEIENIGVEVVGLEMRKSVRNLSNITALFSGKSIFRTLYETPQARRKIDKIISDYDINIVHFESFYTAFLISDELRGRGIKQVYGSENIEFKLYEKYARGKLLSPLMSNETGKIKREEIKMYQDADLCIGVTGEEVEFIKQYAKRCVQIPNGIDPDDFGFQQPERKQADNILFVGNFTYFPNVEAINSFYANVFKNLPKNIRLTVIGRKVSGLKIAKDSRVEALEFIPDIKDAYSKADIFISPVTTGGGTNFKLLEAMAIGVPVVAYGDRAQALGAEDGKNLLIAKDPEDFRNKIEHLLSNFELRVKLSKEARALVEDKYSWENIGKDLSKAWESL